ncbi:hypothetical protein HNV11_21445 [Spirosoma taeanense]|uniref:Uncharacterized protein n=1 Tax=Spirosoma taeanense TaxID=2735870 RepID=A0A6M5YEL7_9BACT|nr:hypothetical protein [Spirosoma taeanense]QJW91761.1 hypothetical protein HNV11_21445 [Spirosoma taeanense]
MRQAVLILVIVVTSLMAMALYCLALINWVQDFYSGVYTENTTEAVVETMTLLVYTYAGIEFFKRKVA